jgi:hypothetical protein
MTRLHGDSGAPQCDLNFPKVESSRRRSSSRPLPRLITDEDRHRQAQRRLVIIERDERLMPQ